MELIACKTEYDPLLLKRALALCPKWRRERADRIADGKRFAEYVTAGALLRYSLGEIAEEITLLPNGKPVLADGKRHFSLSHSGEYIICAVSDKPIGVDIQRIVPISEGVIGRFATESERLRLNSCIDRKKAAIKLWAVKESFMKAAEKSLSEVFGSEFFISEQSGVVEKDGHSFWISEQIDGYIIAVCEEKR